MDVTSESVQLTELDNNKYVGAGYAGHQYSGGIQEYTMWTQCRASVTILSGTTKDSLQDDWLNDWWWMFTRDLNW